MNKIEERNKIIDIIELISHLNNQKLDQQGQVLKILTPSQIFSRLPIALA